MIVINFLHLLFVYLPGSKSSDNSLVVVANSFVKWGKKLHFKKMVSNFQLLFYPYARNNIILPGSHALRTITHTVQRTHASALYCLGPGLKGLNINQSTR